MTLRPHHLFHMEKLNARSAAHAGGISYSAVQIRGLIPLTPPGLCPHPRATA